MENGLRTERQSRGLAVLTLDRPEVRNAFDDRLIGALTQALRDLNEEDSVRVVVLTGAGDIFSSGADLGGMRAMAGFSEEENIADASRLADLMHTLDTLDKPTVARVNGHAFGGAVGLIACCDVAVATEAAGFALSEVRLGLAPAVISPYVVGAIGARAARRYFLTGERMTAADAQSLGLVHIVTADKDLDAGVSAIVDALLAGGPAAQAASKRLIARVGGADDERRASLRAETAGLIAALRVSDEGQEGLSAFLEKRPPSWRESD